jgi:hypothetical protein
MRQKYVILRNPKMTHEEYLALQTLYQMSAYEREEVDHIVTSLINLGMEAEPARTQALENYRAAIRAKMARAGQDLGKIT